MITPPLDICQTEPGVKLNAMYAKVEVNKSNIAGNNGQYIGADVFIKLDLSKNPNFGFLFFFIKNRITHRNSPRNINEH